MILKALSVTYLNFNISVKEYFFTIYVKIFKNNITSIVILMTLCNDDEIKNSNDYTNIIASKGLN